MKNYIKTFESFNKSEDDTTRIVTLNNGESVKLNFDFGSEMVVANCYELEGEDIKRKYAGWEDFDTDVVDVYVAHLNDLIANGKATLV